MPRKRRPQSHPQQMSLLDVIAADRLADDRRDALKGLLAARTFSQHWRGMEIIPPRSFLDEVAALFYRTTDFPLEIPVFLALHSIAAYLLDSGAAVRVAGRTMGPDLWTTILAPSGSGKTLTTEVLARVLPLRQFPEVTSAARFIEELARHNRAAWFQDEWAQVLKRMESQTYAEELRDYLLRLYDNKPIARRTARATIEIADPALVVLGTTVKETFLENVSAESMLDGFMQRFQFVFGDPDPERPTSLFPIYRVMEEDNLRPLHEAWMRIAQTPLHMTYDASSEAESAFCNAFQQEHQRHLSMPSSFFRRVMWRVFKYALVYHVLLCKETPEIDAEDVGWAVRVASLHLADARRLLDSYELNDLEILIRKAESYARRLGRRPTARELISGVRGVTNAPMARFILEVMEAPTNDNTPSSAVAA